MKNNAFVSKDMITAEFTTAGNKLEGEKTENQTNPQKLYKDLLTDDNQSNLFSYPLSPTVSSQRQYFLKNNYYVTSCPLIEQQLQETNNANDIEKKYQSQTQNAMKNQQECKIENSENQDKKTNQTSQQNELAYSAIQIVPEIFNKSKMTALANIQYKIQYYSSFSCCRIVQFLMLVSYYIYQLLWFLYAVGKINQQEESSFSPKIKIISKDNLNENLMVYIFLIISSLSILMQVLANINIVSLMRSQQLYNQNHVFILKFSLFFFEMISFSLFMYHSWQIDSTFKLIGIVGFTQALAFQSYFISSYKKLLFLYQHYQVNYCANPLTLLPITIN